MEFPSFRALLFALAAAVASGCVHDPRGERALQGHNTLPDYIAAPPFDKTIGILVGFTSAQFASGMSVGGSGPDVTLQVEAFAPALVQALRSMGYEAVYLGRPTATCSLLTSGFSACVDNWEKSDGPRVRALLNERNLSTSLIVQLNYRPDSRMYKSVSGGAPFNALLVSMMLHLQDVSGLVLRTGLAPLRRTGEAAGLIGGLAEGAPTQQPWGQVKAVGRSTDGQTVYALRTPDEWAQDLAQRFAEANFPPYVAKNVPSVAEVESLLTSQTWRAHWSYNEKYPGNPKGSGSHTVTFQKRGATIVAQLGADPAMGIGNVEAPVTVTRVGITYFIPTFGRARLTLAPNGQAFAGYTFGQPQMQTLASLRPSDAQWSPHVATMELRGN